VGALLPEAGPRARLALAASSLVIGALFGLVRPWPPKLVGLVLGFGAGALISAVSFELAEEGVDIAGGVPVAIGLGVGAMTYFVAAGRVAAMGGGGALALGAFLDGIPEQMVLGIGLAGGEPVSAGLLAAIFVSNLPEAIGGAVDMRRQMHGRGQVARNWVGIALFCTLATVAGYALADVTGGDFRAFVNGFAAGALIVMLVDSMIPEATEQAGRTTGLVTTLGFAVAAALSL
jgi:zinc transporter, ZIP family